MSWSGTDIGSGVQDFTIYVSDNGGAFAPFQSHVTATSGLFSGKPGHVYGFYSIARDAVGNIEAPKRAAETTTQVVIDSTPPVIVPHITGVLGNNGWYVTAVTINWDVSDPDSGIVSSSGCGTTTLVADTFGVTQTCAATNGVGLSTSVSETIKIDKTAPSITGMPLNCTLWPPNSKLVQVGKVTATDVLSGLVPGSLGVTGSSSEPVGSDPDVAITQDATGGIVVRLRADRSGSGTGRIYMLMATAMDLAGNKATTTATCTVPHDRSR